MKANTLNPQGFETAEFWCIVGLTAILRLLQRKNYFSLICSFYCCIVKEG